MAEGISLSAEERLRYSRQLILPHVGAEGQGRLKAARILLVGAGGLGSPAALYLAAAGIGTLGLVDFDVVDVSNLQRQVLHGTRDIGRSKLESARERIAELNPHVAVETHETKLTAANAMAILGGYDIIVDGSDNFATRYLTSDACVLLGKPNVHGSIFRFDGQASVFCTADGPCYRCLFPAPPPAGLVPSCAEGGVLGVLPGLIGTIQATEAIKLVLGIGESLSGRLLIVDTLGMRFTTVRVPRDPACPACGTRSITELVDYEAFCGAAGNSLPDGGTVVRELEPWALAERLAAGEPPLLVDVREPIEWASGHLANARHIPLGKLAEEMHTLDPEREIVVYCRTGARSAAAARELQSGGFRVSNLSGGILRWLDDVENARTTN